MRLDHLACSFMLASLRDSAIGDMWMGHFTRSASLHIAHPPEISKAQSLLMASAEAEDSKSTHTSLLGLYSQN